VCTWDRVLDNRKQEERNSVGELEIFKGLVKTQSKLDGRVHSI